MDALIVPLVIVVVALVAYIAVLNRRTVASPTPAGVSAADLAVIGELVKGVVDVGAISAGVQGAVESKIREVATSVLSDANDQARRQADERLANQRNALEAQTKALLQPFEQQVASLTGEVSRLREQNAEKFSSVDTAVEGLARQAQALTNVLSSAQGRGNWGERMLEDILSRSGFERGINYEKQETLVEGGRPDYSFFLPPDRVLYLDSKFPADNYLRFFEATDDVARTQYREQFIRNIEERVKELEKRDYVAQSKHSALDYVLLFIPNEGVMGFIQQYKPTLIDDAIARKVVLCSPLTLYAFLGVVRQATDSFHMERNANEVLVLLTSFGKAWKSYVKNLTEIQSHFDKMQKKLKAVTTGKVMTSLRKPLNEIEDLAKKRQLEGDDDTLRELSQAIEDADVVDDSIDDDDDE
jgi:DNA recombination protein RmuC